MSSLLSKEERTQIVNSHKKNLAMNQYNLELSVIEENAKASPDSATLVDLNRQITAIDDQIEALDAEIALIAAEA